MTKLGGESSSVKLSLGIFFLLKDLSCTFTWKCHGAICMNLPWKSSMRIVQCCIRGQLLRSSVVCLSVGKRKVCKPI
jgi:hypothetical protein